MSEGVKFLGWWVFLVVCLAVAVGLGLEPSDFTRLLWEDDRPQPTDGRVEISARSERETATVAGDMPDTIQAAELSSRAEKEIASGRCAPAIVLGVYDWESCAWLGTRDPEMSKPEMQALIARVWRETDTPGKPSWPPDLEEGPCGWLLDVAGCYEPASHAIEVVSGRSENFTLQVLLHELAHALISDSDEMAACADDWTHRQSVCGHGNLFRCVADDLYVRYAGLDTAGVCGQAPDLDPGDWQLLAPDESEWGVIHSAAQVTDPESNHTLRIMCVTNYEQSGEPARQLEAILFLEHGRRLRRAAPDYQVRIRYRFSDEEYLSDRRWMTDENLTMALWPERDASSLVGRFQGADRLFLRIEHTQRDIVQVEFDLGDSPALAVTQEACNYES